MSATVLQVCFEYRNSYAHFLVLSNSSYFLSLELVLTTTRINRAAHVENVVQLRLKRGTDLATVVGLHLTFAFTTRSRPSEFTLQLSQTQAVEFLGEWSLSPDNVAFLRINNSE